MLAFRSSKRMLVVGLALAVCACGNAKLGTVECDVLGDKKLLLVFYEDAGSVDMAVNGYYQRVPAMFLKDRVDIFSSDASYQLDRGTLQLTKIQFGTNMGTMSCTS